MAVRALEGGDPRQRSLHAHKELDTSNRRSAKISARKQRACFGHSCKVATRVKLRENTLVILLVKSCNSCKLVRAGY